MIGAEEYLAQTKHAVSAIFEIVQHYSDIAKLSFSPVHSVRHSGAPGEATKKYQEWRSQSSVQQEFEVAKYARDEYFANQFSIHVASGSILQIACKAIDLYAKGGVHSEQCEGLFHNCTDITKERGRAYCIGKLVRNVPIGLIIYAGRNQYNHMEEGANLNRLNRNIFSALARNHNYGDLDDPAFDLENIALDSYSSNVRAVLDWDSYDTYENDMKDLLKIV